MKLNENIRNFRKFRNMTQTQLAKKVSKSKSVISHWESGENSPDLDSCEKLCKALNVTPNQLFGWEKNEEFEAHAEKIWQIQTKIAELNERKQEIDEQISRLEIEMWHEEDPLLDVVDDEDIPELPYNDED